MPYQKLRLILGDQLNAQHSWYQQKDAAVLYLIAEIRQETDYVKHHVQKICAFFAAMANFATALQKAGHQVLYLTLDDTQQYQSLPELIIDLCERYQIESFEYQQPDEFRLNQQLEQLSLQLDLTTKCVETEHFLLSQPALAEEFKSDTHITMENFYRKMRKKFNILMNANQPLGGKWNYDAENRHKLTVADLADIPEPLLFANDVEAILSRLERHSVEYFGRITEKLIWPTNRQQALKLLAYFCRHNLPQFGRFQDAMTGSTPHQWSLYHSRLSFALNAKMLHPMLVIQAAIQTYEESRDQISLAQIEGFVRQILGWREYVRGIYWVNMPNYAQKNALQAQRKLPAYFWHGETQMRCLQSGIQQSLDYAYAHHIQRLMVIGNFCLLAGIDPDEVDTWYLGVYVDAIEWVEMPNVRGMSLFADDGLIATKPYAAGGNYINKMSDYCKHCHYDVKQKTSANACPFNSLYWHFMCRHREKLEKNPRIGMVYRTWDKQSPEQQSAILERAEEVLSSVEISTAYR